MFLKKIIIFLLIIGLIVTGIFVFKPKKETKNLTKVKLAEVTHSIFYAPQYAAIALGYFEDYGIDIELTLVPGATNLKR